MGGYAVNLEIGELNAASGHVALRELRSAIAKTDLVEQVSFDSEADTLIVIGASIEDVERAVTVAHANGVSRVGWGELEDLVYRVDGPDANDDRPWAMQPVFVRDGRFIGSIELNSARKWDGLSPTALAAAISAELADANLGVPVDVTPSYADVWIACDSIEGLEAAAHALQLPGLAPADDGEFDPEPA